MTEEQACLVRARSDSESSSKVGSFGSISRTMAYPEDRLAEGGGSGEPTGVHMPSSPDNVEGGESGELIDYNDSSVLEQFHEDALRQAGCGLAQARILLAISLAICGWSLELASIPFVLPSAEIELCILPHEKNWLVLISLVGGSLGAVGWGVLSERLGRRRTLLSCLAVNAVFAAIAAFMPTYGTFMMARFCSAIGSGGILVTSYTYLGECCPRSVRAMSLTVCVLAAGGGALLAVCGARAILPRSGEDTLIENKEHFSAWHRYLLLCTLPILASLVSLIWTQESPRYLLDVGREVDAMMVYQSIHSSNQFRICGKNSVVANNAESEYRLGELSLPGKRRPPGLHHVRHSVKMVSVIGIQFWQSFFQLFSNTHRTTTLTLGAILLFTMAIQFYLSSFVPAKISHMQTEHFRLSKLTYVNATFEDAYYNETIENVDYVGTSFVNCTFKDMLLSHVNFVNCSFRDVSFSNVRTSYTKIVQSTIVNSTIIDTDMEQGREIDMLSVVEATAVRGVRGGCARTADLAWSLSDPLREHQFVANAALLAAPLALLLSRARPLLSLCLSCLCLSVLVYFSGDETTLYCMEALYRIATTLIFFIVSVEVVDYYPANLRCTAHGVILSAMQMWGCGARAGATEVTSNLFASLTCASLSAAALAAAAFRRHALAPAR